MSMLPDKIVNDVKKEFLKITKPVKLVLFTQELECLYCRETHRLAEEVAALSSFIELQVFDFMADKEAAEKYKIDKIPALVVMGDEDQGIRLFGIPSGYEFTSLIAAIMAIGTGETGLKAKTLEQLKKIDQPVHLQVMVTPTCPYCPRAVVSAMMMALANPLIRADMVEMTEFPFLAQRYGVEGVPMTLINETGKVIGAVPEHILVQNILQTLGK